MRAFWCVMLLASVALADPKSVPPKFAKAAGEAFTKAQEADAAGRLDEAIRQYERANAIAPHPSTYYNLADALHRRGRLDAAADAYAKYLELAPEASDHKAIEALIASLRAAPATLVIELEEPDAQVFVDGKPAGAAPATVTNLAKGTYQIDVVTPITFGDMACAVSAGAKRTCRVHARPRVDGNVVLSGSRRMGGRSWPIGDQRFHMHGRFAVRPGHYELVRVVERQCAPLSLDVPVGEDAVIYAFVSYPDPPPAARECVDLKISQRQLTFDTSK